MDNDKVYIGKGSFSNVYLYSKNSSSLFTEELETSSFDARAYIVKEININKLVKKYINRSKFKTISNLKDTKESKIRVSLTPYENGAFPNNLKDKYNENEYYYNRLKDLIESEVEILKKINHANIIKFYESYEKEEIYCIKMEYCNHGDLYSLLKNDTYFQRNELGGFKEDFFNKFLNDTSSVLLYLHENNIIHRDIKLQNILVQKTPQGNYTYKFSDFGFTCFDMTCNNGDNDEFMSDVYFKANLLKKKYHKLCGTPYYMAPEIILNIELFEQLLEIKPHPSDSSKCNKNFYDKKSDLWSYGICLYELMFKSLPYSNIYDIFDLKCLFEAENTQVVLFKTIDNAKIINDGLKILLKKLLSMDPNRRFDHINLNNYISTLPTTNLFNDNCNTEINSTQDVQELRKDVIVEPLSSLSQSWYVESKDNFKNSWDKINTSSSLLLKMSIDNKFIKWMFKNE